MFRTPSRQARLSRPTTPSTPLQTPSQTPTISVSVRIKPSQTPLQHTPTSITVPDLGEFTFDNVFGPLETNKDVYDSLVKAMVSRLLDGFNATVFAYGTTGSGKTHSMSGSLDGELGVIPLAVQELFDLSAQRNEEILVKCSYMEIYNEKINDLLDTQRVDLKLRETPELGVQPLGITEKVVSSSKQLLQLISLGDDNRKTNSTEYNLKSSRSHAIVQIRVISKGRYNSVLSLCDLAGSERATSSSDRRKEGSYINKSLLSLTNVIVKLSNASNAPSGSASSSRASSRDTPVRRSSLATATPRTPMRSTSSLSFGRSSSSLSNRGGDANGTAVPSSSSASATHIPYRDSKLTRLLQSSLSGNALVGILCTISSSSTLFTETINTIRFASRAKNIKLLNVKRNEAGLMSTAEKDKLIETLKGELSMKDDLIRELRKGRGVAVSNNGATGVIGHNDSSEIIDLKEKIIQLESENKLLIENQTHLTRLQETRTYSSTILKNDIISQIVNNELSTDDTVVKLEELFKVKYLEIEEYRSYVAHLENSLRLEISRYKNLEMLTSEYESANGVNKSTGDSDELNQLVQQQKEEIQDLSTTLQNKEKIINFLKKTMKMNQNLARTINHSSEDYQNGESRNGDILNDVDMNIESTDTKQFKYRKRDGDLSGVMEDDNEDDDI